MIDEIAKGHLLLLEIVDGERAGEHLRRAVTEREGG